MQYLEGDCLQLFDGSIWVVKGSYHPPGRVIAFPRLVDGRKVKRIGEALNIIQRYYSHFLTYVDFIGRYVPAVPKSFIKKHFRALSTGCPEKNDDISSLCNELLEILSSKCGLKCGVTGSLLYGEYTAYSDIDLVCIDRAGAYECLRKLRKNEILKRFSHSDFITEFADVSEGLSFNDHLRLILSRVTQGVFKSRRYTLRIINSNREQAVLGPYSFSYYSEVIVRVTSSDYRTPSIYNVDIIKPYITAKKVFMVSFRVRYTEIPKGTILLVTNALFALRYDDVAVISLDSPSTYVKILT